MKTAIPHQLLKSANFFFPIFATTPAAMNKTLRHTTSIGLGAPTGTHGSATTT